MDQNKGELFFQVIDARYERGSTVITTNRAFRDWGTVFQDKILARGIIDRLVHHSEVIRIEGTSYRLKERKPVPGGIPNKTSTVYVDGFLTEVFVRSLEGGCAPQRTRLGNVTPA